MTVVDVLGSVDELADWMGGSVDAVTGAASGPYRKSRIKALLGSSCPSKPHRDWSTDGSAPRIQRVYVSYALLRRLVLPVAIQNWSLTSLQQRLLETGGLLIRHARYFTLQLAESYLTRPLFRQILARIERLAWHPT